MLPKIYKKCGKTNFYKHGEINRKNFSVPYYPMWNSGVEQRHGTRKLNIEDKSMHLLCC